MSQMVGVANSDERERGEPSSWLRFWLPVWTLSTREIVRFLRQRTRLVGAVGQPVLFWILFGAGLGGSFRNPAWAGSEPLTYQEYFFPGIATLIVLFTAIFSTISIIEDRREGFLQSVLVAPIPRTSLVLGKLFGGSVLALIQAGLFLALGPLLSAAGIVPTMELGLGVGSFLLSAAFLFLIAFALTALGYCIAWPLDSTQGFHAIMSVFLMPMWLLSGAFFPGEGAGWLSWIIRLNPLTYGVAGLRRLISPEREFAVGEGLPSLEFSLSVTILFAATCTAGAIWLTRRRKVIDAR